MTETARPDAMDLDLSPEAILRWYADAGVDECILDAPVDRFHLSAELLAEAEARRRQAPAARPESPAPGGRAAPARQAPPAQRPASPPVARGPGDRAGEDIRSAARMAAEAQTLEDLRGAVERFESCPLKVTATNTVFADGNPDADLMIIGEAPGAEEDRQGKPFVGASGQLLDRMLASIGFDRSTFYITNVIPWRPPGNRKPTPQEVGMCLPFIRRHVELAAPKAILMVGGLSAQSLLDRTEGITRLRGRWFEYASPNLPAAVPAIASFHPAYLLRSPQMKKLAWRDLLLLRERLRELGAAQ
ncbi:Uracil-DNA glycosylase, family 4 [Caenispirillum salinarum AK4]|uniref:Type-4 uracil-DNA glycosylase n=1 Tax=Caenispirillum salinarum AK4 TaxID=1238182 RepID=K9H300_9PROT|nr:uracil-DNA glycosylase [Caenispirillum salinarum]EKV32610.1 Uracil-DNA glycosylase, family 4 [Caenispirillum salinarum AK4]